LEHRPSANDLLHAAAGARPTFAATSAAPSSQKAEGKCNDVCREGLILT
jgi:hypothetical protein